MQIKGKGSEVTLEQFNSGLKKALADDGRIGLNDVPALKDLAVRAGHPELATLVDRFHSGSATPAHQAKIEGAGYANQVVSFKPGTGGGFNGQHTEFALGRPEGSGGYQGSLHVVSLGTGGQMTLKLGRAVTGGLKVFENGIGPSGQAVNPEPAKVEVSPDGVQWFALQGTAGNATVEANSQNHIRAREGRAGGDVFHFSKSGIPAGTKIQFVRITDLGQSVGPGGAGGTAGFDLDAVYGF